MVTAPVADAAEKPAEGAEPTPPATPTFEAFTLPEGFQAAPEQLESFHSVLGKYGLTQEAGQELIDLHATEIKRQVEAMAQQQLDTWQKTRAGWREDFFKTAGNRSDTIANDARFAIGELVKDANERKALHEVLAVSGVGDNKHVIKLLAAAGRRLRERSAPPPGLSQNGARSTDKPTQRYGPQPRR